MSTAKFTFVIVLLLTLIHKANYVQCSIISQSSISMCEAGDEKNPKTEDGSPCKSKMLVSMTLRGGQVRTHFCIKSVCSNHASLFIYYFFLYREKQSHCMLILTRLSKRKKLK